MKYSLTIFFIFVLATSGKGEEKGMHRKETAYQQAQEIMVQQIMQLKDGVLLVRLQTRENSIRVLNQAGKTEQADKIKNRQRKYNMKIYAAFKECFTFCPIYFFFSNYSDSIRNGHAGGIVFLNENLEADTGIKLGNSKFLTAEFGALEKDTTKYFTGQYLYAGEHGLERRNQFSTGPNFGFPALKIMSDQLVQLKKPFPYYVRTFESLPIKRRVSKTVERMNSKLLYYYNQNKED